MNIDKLKNILNNLYLWDEDNCGELKIVLIDSDNWETEVDGVYFNERENKLYLNANNACGYENSPDFRVLYKKRK